MEVSRRVLAEVFTVQPPEILSNWHWIEPFLDRVDDADWTSDGVQLELMRGNAQLWAAHDAQPVGIWITKIEETSAGRRGLLWIAAGEPVEVGLKLFHEYTEPWLKSQGCKSIQILGRKGWKRVLPDYRDVGVILVKEFA